MAQKEVDKDVLGNDTVLTDLVGNHAKARILSVFWGEKRNDMNISKIADQAGIDRSTVYEHIDDLLEIEVITETRKIGSSQMYQLNPHNDTAQALDNLFMALIGDHPE